MDALAQLQLAKLARQMNLTLAETVCLPSVVEIAARSANVSESRLRWMMTSCREVRDAIAAECRKAAVACADLIV